MFDIGFNKSYWSKGETVLFKLLRKCKRRNKGNFKLKSN